MHKASFGAFSCLFQFIGVNFSTKTRRIDNTLGHSNHSQEDFLRLLQTHSITCVVDVRSMPASKHSPQYNQDILERFLKYHHINYHFFGREFGARRTDSYNLQGQVDFELAVKTDLFQHGAKRINTLQKGLCCSKPRRPICLH